MRARRMKRAGATFTCWGPPADLQVNAGDTIVLGNEPDVVTGVIPFGEGTLTALRGHVVVAGYLGTDGVQFDPVIVLDDGTDATARNVTIAISPALLGHHDITGLAPAVITYGGLLNVFAHDANLISLEIFGGTGSNTFKALDLGVQTTVLNPGSNGRVELRSTTGDVEILGGHSLAMGLGVLNAVRGQVILTTEGDPTSLTIDDSKDSNAGPPGPSPPP